MPNKISIKSRSSGKGKSLTHSRSSVPPNDLIEGPTSEPKIHHGSKTRSRVKAPTKKEQQEMFKERTRLAAGSTVSIPRENISKYTKEGFFTKIRGSSKMIPSAPILEPLPLSDPIETYSSPPTNRRASPIRAVAAASSLARTKVSASKSLRSPEGSGSDSEELPDVSNIVKEADAKRKKQELLEMKKRVVQKQSMSPDQHHQSGSDDDDLMVVNSNAKISVKEEEGRRSTKQQHVSMIRKQQMQLAHVNPSRKKEGPLLKGANGEGPSSVLLQPSIRLDQESLSRVLAVNAQLQAKEVSQKRANEWQKHGGHLPAQPAAPAEGLATTVQILAERGMKAAEANTANRMDIDADESDDADDEDWDPTLRGSASPRLVKNEENEEESEEDNDENILEEDVTMAEADDVEEAEESKVRATRRMVVVSDDEDEDTENIPPPARRYRRESSSAELPTEDEYDKENNTDLMYDRSDDKENTAVVRHTPLASGSRSIFDITASGSPEDASREWDIRNQKLVLGNSSTGKSRRPFKELLSEESPSSSHRGPSTLTQSFAARLQQASPAQDVLSPAPTLKEFRGAKLTNEKSLSGFSQLLDSADNDVFTAAPLLEPGFSDLFESTTQKQKSPAKLNKGKGKARARLDEDLSGEISLRPIDHGNTLDLTQDVYTAVNLQPPFEDGENLMRKADSIFEKEQAFLVESALHVPAKKPELYVNDHGFLTQTKPMDNSPEIYRQPPQSTFAGNTVREISPSQSRPRAPLRTLSYSSVHQPESPDQPLRRLRKNGNLSPGSDDGLTMPPPPQNAFDLLARGAAKAHKRDEKKSKRPTVDLSEFLENEAAESDEENNRFGMVVRAGDDEEDGEDLDRTLDALMDDKEMDEETVAAERVLEKFKEQEEEQDKKDQELHEAAISGRLRLKRTRGVGIDDSDEESDDDDNERARRAMKKLRKSDRGDIQDLEANEATRPFAEAYIQGLKDDDEDLSYLAMESNFDDILDDKKFSYEDEEDGDSEEEMESISPQEIARRARQMIEEEVEEPHLDPLDVSWLDKDTEDDAPRVKTVRSRQRVPVPQHDMDPLEVDGSLLHFCKPADKANAFSKQWCAQETKSRNAGTSRSVGGSAITGHARSKARTDSGSVHKGPMKKAESASTTSSRSLKPERSALSSLTDKSGLFG
ncbi:hypothetical protein BDN70DRAFT_487886 [Pholiota conissans]|uniref:DNA replication checkpoint mediator MRC1 domain-containing protein n=1 Tax=Pholiota conissans TaxID=109636 RepID=A0A9P6CWM1_9AGAR|nr:hypothetical protein BDN70DRAFT_487886 [Pholiota conissans]